MNIHWQQYVLPTLGVIGLFAILGVVGDMDFQDAQQEEAHYCAMRRLYEANNHLTSQRPGWPNFKPEIKCPVKI